MGISVIRGSGYELIGERVRLAKMMSGYGGSCGLMKLVV
jgi:hypothetical protein